MKKILLTFALFVPFVVNSFAGTNAAVTINTNTYIVSPTNLWRTNSAALIDALTNAGFAVVGGSVNSNAFIAATNGNATTLTNLQAANLTGAIGFSNLPHPLAAADGNFLDLDGNYDGNGDNILLTNTLYGQGLLLDGQGGIDFYAGNSHGGGISFYSPTTVSANFSYWQQGASGFTLTGTTSGNATSQPVLSLVPSNFSSAFPNDLLVLPGNSNNYTTVLGARGTIGCAALWWNYTNISGRSSYAADFADRRIICNPSAASCQITLNAIGPFAELPTTNWFGWMWNTVSSIFGNPRGPAHATLDSVIENTGSNTANTLSVCLADHSGFTNCGTTNLVIPSLTSVRLTADGTNVFAEFSTMTPVPIFTSLTAGNLTVVSTLALGAGLGSTVNAGSSTNIQFGINAGSGANWSTNEYINTPLYGMIYLTNVNPTSGLAYLLTNWFPAGSFTNPPLVSIRDLGVNSILRGMNYGPAIITASYFVVGCPNSAVTNTGYGMEWHIYGQTNAALATIK